MYKTCYRHVLNSILKNIFVKKMLKNLPIAFASTPALSLYRGVAHVLFFIVLYYAV